MPVTERLKPEPYEVERTNELHDVVGRDGFRHECAKAEHHQKTLAERPQAVTDNRCQRCSAAEGHAAADHEHHARTRHHNDDEGGHRKRRNAMRINHAATVATVVESLREVSGNPRELGAFREGLAVLFGFGAKGTQLGFKLGCPCVRTT